MSVDAPMKDTTFNLAALALAVGGAILLLVVLLLVIILVGNAINHH